MKIEKLFCVLVVGGAALGVGAACGGAEGEEVGEEGTQQSDVRLADGGIADAGTRAPSKPTGSGGGSTGGGVSGW